MNASPKFQICVGIVIAYASFRFRQMTKGNYLMEGSYFQHAEFLLNAFVGVCWIRADLISYAIVLIINTMVVACTSIYLSMTSLDNLAYYGTFRTKYFFESAQKWNLNQLVQAEAALDIILGMILIKALEEIEREHLEIAAAERAREQEMEQGQEEGPEGDRN